MGGPSQGEEADVAGERVRLILNRLADIARNGSIAKFWTVVW